MPARQHRITLSAEDRQRWTRLTRTGSTPARAQTHARILLLADPSTHGPVPSDRAIAG